MAQHPTTAPSGIGGLVNPPAQQPNVPPATPEAEQELKKGWLDFLKNPEVKAGLAQFAINALQPPALGQTTLGHLSSAVGAGGEAIGRRREGIKADEAATAEAELDRRRVEVSEEGLAVDREAIASRASTAAADRASRESIEGGRISEAARISAEEIKVRLDISQNTQENSILNSVMGLWTQHNEAVMAGAEFLEGEERAEALKALWTTADMFALNEEFKGVADGKRRFSDGRISDEELIALPPENWASVKSQIDEAQVARVEAARIPGGASPSATTGVPKVEPAPKGKTDEAIAAENAAIARRAQVEGGEFPLEPILTDRERRNRRAAEALR